ncbi:Retrovirus-related Pol polyprotein, partial [Mucuna pruriens]
MNPNLLDVFKKEVTKLLAVGIIYPISDSQWVSPVQVMPKKSRMTVIKNWQVKMVPARIQNTWHVCIDYRKLNQATRKDHFSLSFIDQVLEKLVDSHSTCGSTQDYLHMYVWNVCIYKDVIWTVQRLEYFQRCMISIFSDLLEYFMEVFMDDFTVYAESFEACLDNLSKVLRRFINSNLVLNFEKCHFMIAEGIVLGHLVSTRGIEVEKAKIYVISSLPNLASMREVFIGDLSKTSVRSPCLCPRVEEKTYVHAHPPSTELEASIQANVRRLQLRARGSPRPTTLKYLLKKPYANLRLIWFMLLLEEFDVEIRDKKGVENAVVDHLSQLEREPKPIPIQDEFLDEQILQMTHATPWYADICNCLVSSMYPITASKAVKERLESDAKYYIWDDPYLWRLCNGQVTRRCISEFKIKWVLHFCHSMTEGGHYGSM